MNLLIYKKERFIGRIKLTHAFVQINIKIIEKITYIQCNEMSVDSVYDYICNHIGKMHSPIKCN